MDYLFSEIINNSLINLSMIISNVLMCISLMDFRKFSSKQFASIGLLLLAEFFIYLFGSLLFGLKLFLSLQPFIFLLPTLLLMYFICSSEGRIFFFAFFSTYYIASLVNALLFLLLFRFNLREHYIFNITMRVGSQSLACAIFIAFFSKRIRSFFDVEGVLWNILTISLILSLFGLYVINSFPVTIDNRTHDFFFSYCVIFILLMVYAVVILALSSMHKNKLADQKGNEMEMKLLLSRELAVYGNKRYEKMLKTFNEIRKAKHNLKHHLTVISGLYLSKEYDKIGEYADECLKTIPEVESCRYSNIFSLEVVLNSYEDIYKEDGFLLSIDKAISNINTPNNLELSLLIENILQFGYELLLDDEESSLKGMIVKVEDNQLIFSLDNCNMAGEEKNFSYLMAKNLAEANGWSLSYGQSSIKLCL